MLKQLHHKKNELFEVEFFQNEECTVPFDFTNAKNLYIELKDGDITPLHHFSYNAPDYNDLRMFTPYLPYNSKTLYAKGYRSSYEITTLDDITPNLSKYIPEDNAVLFLSEEDCKKYSPIKKYNYNQKGHFSNPENVNDVWLTTFDAEYNTLIAKVGIGLYDVDDDCLYRRCPESGNRIYFKKITIFLPHGTQSEIQKANEVAKELKEKYGVEEVNLFALHCFVEFENLSFGAIKLAISREYDIDNFNFNKIITTNSTGILKPEDSNERLQVINCKEIFEEYLRNN